MLRAQMAANLRDGGRHRRKTLRELFADGRGGAAPPAAFPMDQIIRAGSESAALEVGGYNSSWHGWGQG
jgi:hypothetical protein